MSDSEVLEELFPQTANVLVKDGEINDIQGTYHYYDYSQRITNNRCNNIIDNTLNNVSNTFPQVKCMFPRLSSDFLNRFDYTFLDHETGARSTHHGRFATSTVATVDGSAISHYLLDHRSSPVGSHTWFTL